MNKRGSHVGMILSFALFITFIVFLYSITRPAFNTGTDKKAVLANLQGILVNNISSNMTTITVSIPEQEGNLDYVELKDFFLMQEISPRVIVKNTDSEILPSYWENFTSLFVERGDSDNIIKVYYSEKFSILTEPEDGGSTKLEKDEGYSIGAINKFHNIFEVNIVNLKEYYEGSYEQLKSDFNIPPGTEFYFIFEKDNGGTISPEDNKLKPNNVYTTRNPVQYIDDEAKFQTGFINIQVW